MLLNNILKFTQDKDYIKIKWDIGAYTFFIKVKTP